MVAALAKRNKVFKTNKQITCKNKKLLDWLKEQSCNKHLRKKITNALMSVDLGFDIENIKIILFYTLAAFAVHSADLLLRKRKLKLDYQSSSCLTDEGSFKTPGWNIDGLK